MQAVILAAGMGTRLKELTQDSTKCMVRVNGTSLIERMIRQIQKDGAVSKLTIVVGYRAEKLRQYIRSLEGVTLPIDFIDNPLYAVSNNIYSLSLAQDVLTKDDTLLFESDLILEDSILERLIHDPRPNLAVVDRHESWMDGTCVRLAPDDSIEAFIPGKLLRFEEAGSLYKTVNLYKFSREFSENVYVPFLNAYQKALGENEYYEQVLRVITAMDGSLLKGMRLSGEKWYEIDDIQDLDIASTLFETDPEKKVERLSSRGGGSWRFPGMLDFTCPSNPYFPPQKMKDEIRVNFDALITCAPSRPEVSSMVAAKLFGVHEENLVVSSSKEELLAGLSGLLGSTPDSLKGDLSGENVEGLLREASEKHLPLLIDESLLDFEKDHASLIRQDVLTHYPDLYILRDLSASCGIEGLPLAVLASGNEKVITRLKTGVLKGRLSAVAEFYLQIAEKYKKDYWKSLACFREEKARFENELSRIEGLTLLPGTPSTVRVHVPSSALRARLLSNHHLLVTMEEASEKGENGGVLCLSVRGKEDDDQLLHALKKELSEG